MKQAGYVTGSYVLGPYSGTVTRNECQPTAFGVPDKKNHHWDGSWDWVNYRTTNHLKSAWSFTVTRADNGQVLSAHDNYEYWNDWNWIDYGGTILTFYNVPGMYAVNGNFYSNQMIPKFQFDGGYYYTDGVPEANKLLMKCP